MATITEYTGEGSVDLVQVGLGIEPAILITVKPEEEHTDDPDDLPLNIDFSLLNIDQATVLLETIVSVLQANGYGEYSEFDYEEEEEEEED